MATSRTLRTTLKCLCHSAHIFRCLYSLGVTRRLLVDNGCRSAELCNTIQYCLACQNLSIPPDVKMSSKKRCVTVAESLFLKNVSTANGRCSSEQHCTMTENFKPLYPAMCVSPRHLQRCRHGAKFKLFVSALPCIMENIDKDYTGRNIYILSDRQPSRPLTASI
jgi:hypothetical protein